MAEPPLGTDCVANDLDVLSARPEVAHRFVVRTEEQALPAAEGTYRPARVVLVGGGPVASALASELASRGSHVAMLELQESPDALEANFERLLSEGPFPDVCLLSGVARLQDEDRSLAGLAASTAKLRARLLEGPFQ